MKKILFLCASVFCLGTSTASVAEPVEVNSSPEHSSQQLDSQIDSQIEKSGKTVTLPPVEVTVLDRGAEPRQVLRLKSKLGDKQRSRMVMSIDPKIMVDGQPFPGMVIPPIEMVTEMETVSVNPDGTTRVKFQYIESIIDESNEESALMNALMKQQFELLSKSSMYFVYDSQGRLKETEIEFEGGAEDSARIDKFLKQIASATQQSSGMFPEEAIGIGAVWSSPQSATVNGITISQNIVYKLLDVQGDRITLAMSLGVNGDSTQLDLTGLIPLPPDVQTKISAFDMTGVGTMTFNLSQLLATSMNLDSQLSMEMIFTDPKKTTTIQMDMSSTVQVSEE